MARANKAVAKARTQKLSSAVQEALAEELLDEREEQSELQQSLGFTRHTLKSDIWPAEVVIIDKKSGIRAYFADAYDPSNSAPPDCFSSGDGIGNGHIRVNGKNVEHTSRPCEGHVDGKGKVVVPPCPMNQFGSALAGKGKACGEKTMLIVHRKDAPVSIELVSVPITSANNLIMYLLELINKGVSRLSIWTTISIGEGKRSDVFKFAEGKAVTDNDLVTWLVQQRKFVRGAKLGRADVSREDDSQSFAEVSDA